MQSRLLSSFFYIAELCTSPRHRYLTTFWCKADSRGNEGRYLKQKYTKEQLQIDCCTLMSGGHGKWVGGLSWDRTSSLILFRRGAPCRGLFVFSLLSRFPILPRPINLPPFLQPFSVLSSSSKLCVGSVSSLLWQFSHISYPSLRLNPLTLETLSGKNYFPLLVKKKKTFVVYVVHLFTRRQHWPDYRALYLSHSLLLQFSAIRCELKPRLNYSA